MDTAFINLFGDLEEPKLQKVSTLLAKTKTTKVDVDPIKQLKSKKLSLKDRLEIIKAEVLRVLGKQVENTLVIRDIDSLHDYISKAIKNGRIDIDTETNNSLDPITCKLMGPCIYTPGEKHVYIPINHTDLDDNLLEDQLTEADINREFQRLIDANTHIIFHNGKFDYQVIKCTCNIKLPIYWDTMIAAKLLNENEPAGLKWQYINKIDQSQEKYDIEHLFAGVEYKYVPPEIFALYAATDAMMTDKLYEYQVEQFELPGLQGVYKLFRDVEVQNIEVVAEIELAGVTFDTEYAQRLKVKYENILAGIDTEINAELDNLATKIAEWKLTPDATTKPKKKTGDGLGKSKLEQLEDPINLASPTQLAILLYDILKVGIIDKKAPRGTGEEVLSKIELPICKLLLKRRGVVKLLDAFILSLPENVNPADGRIHCKFNQYGADTGRFSCSNPNLQQIPSHNKELRLLFKAQDGYTLVGSDFSQQEPRLLSFYSRDTNMINAYKQGKDLYATIAKGVYHMDYWDCMEHHEDGSPNPEGKKRRASCKAILLGIMYGRGANAIAEQIHSTKEEAQKIIDNFYASFPQVKTWMDESLRMLRETGEVTDFYGRKRRLPDIKLPPYVVSYIDPTRAQANSEGFNPFFECSNRTENDNIIKYYTEKAAKIRYNKDYDLLKAEALKYGVNIQANTGKIAQAERQCVNARIQGGAATMTKIAMNKLYRDQELRNLKFKMLIGVHDELIGECPKENADKVAERLTYIMKTCVADIVDVPFKCDASICDAWYYDEMSYALQDKFQDYRKMGMSEDDAIRQLKRDHCELLPEQLEAMLQFK